MVEPGLKPLLQGEDIFAGAWRCPGSRRGWAAEPVGRCEVELPVAGMHLRAVRGARWVVDPTRVLVHAPGEDYLMASPTGRPQRSTVLRLEPALLDELRIRPGTRAFALEAAPALLHARFLAEQDPLAREELALALVERLLAGPASAPPKALPGSQRRLAQRLEEALSVRFPERLSLSELARSCGASPFHASRAFRAATGQTLHRRLTQLRLRAALYQLEGQGGRLASLALSLGFSSHSHFTLAFRKEYGRSPSDWAGSRA